MKKLRPESCRRRQHNGARVRLTASRRQVLSGQCVRCNAFLRLGQSMNSVIQLAPSHSNVSSSSWKTHTECRSFILCMYDANTKQQEIKNINNNNTVQTDAENTNYRPSNLTESKSIISNFHTDAKINQKQLANRNSKCRRI